MRKPVPDRDDLYSWLYHHMVLDDSVFPDERQRLEHSTGILMGVLFGCRLCTLFDTRVKLDLPNIDDLSLDDKVVRVDGANSKLRDQNSMVFDFDCESNKPRRIHNNNDNSCSDAKIAYNSQGDCDSDVNGDSDSDSNSLYDLDGNSDTDDECTAGSEETRSFLYRHFTIYIVPNPDPRKPNIIFTKITLIHTKGEDNNPRM